MPFSEYYTGNDTFEKNGVTETEQRDHSAELCRPVLFLFKVLQQQVNIVFTVSLFTCITRGINTRRSVQAFYFKAGIIRKAGQSVMIKNVLSLLKGITFQRIGGLREIHVAAYVAQA